MRAINQAFFDAWRHTTRQHPELDDDDGGLGWSYYRDELNWVIKGRGLRSIDEYLGLARTGRGTPLQESHRRAVWALYERYEQELERRRSVDFSDLLGRALELLETGRATTPYQAVVVDEVQDLTEMGIRLAYALAGGDQRDGLFVVGDGQQSVYPGGYSLKSVGVDVVGRSTVLKTNYRNTRQILDAARRIVAGSLFDDLDDELVTGTREIVCLRDGPPPVFEAFDDRDGHNLGLAAAVEAAIDRDGVDIGDVAILVPTNRLVDDYASVIRDLGLATMKLQKYEGATQDLVKIGTYQRGKGLEFKRVFLPRLDPEGLGEERRHDEDEQAHAERLELLRRQLFVAMTRARDHVWAGWVGRPASILDIEGTDG
jgi:superfamily I DNA/RNA helicase